MNYIALGALAAQSTCWFYGAAVIIAGYEPVMWPTWIFWGIMLWALLFKRR